MLRHPLGRLLIAAAIGGGAFFVVLKISQSKNEKLAGDGAFVLDEGRKAESEAYDRLCEELRSIGKPELADRLFAMQRRGRIWVVPALRGNRWAVYVNTMNLVRRIYIEQKALTNPRQHFFQGFDVGASERHKQAFAFLTLAGTLYHELQHYDGIYEEAAAYEREIDWYLSIRQTKAVSEMGGGERGAYEWAIQAAVRSAQKGKSLAQ